MQRYETVARDVGDTDARLMDEINKQRQEMSEMANMWQECLQRYRDISNDFNSLKQQLKTESPPRAACRPVVPPACADGEGALPVPPAPYCMPPAFAPPPVAMPGMGGGYAGAPLRQRASAPPAWWHKCRDRDEPRYKEKPKSGGARSDHRHRKR
ncbi:hypothetical protein NE865_02083 [Phthorimaea operculella]|nr:hypothetical protein NE865_02083 [Phthorimaea operculella]